VGRKKQFHGTTAINIPAFTGNSYQYDPSKKKLHTSLELTTSLSNENSTQITNVVYEPITTAQLGALEPENIPKQIVTLRNTQSRGITQSFLSLSPIVMNMALKDKSFFYRITTTAKTSPSNKVASTYL
jgi:hypothetical protein